MQISGAAYSQPVVPINRLQTSSSEEAGEAANGTAEETREKTSITKSAEQSRGMGNIVDTLA